MSVAVQWQKAKAPLFREFSLDYRNAIRDFALLWGFEPVMTKAMLIQQFLLSLYINDVRNVGVPIDALISSIRADERQPVLEAFRARIGSEGLPDFLEDMIASWPIISPAMSDEAILANVIEFQRTANRERPLPRLESAPIRIPQGDDRRSKPRVRRLHSDIVRRRATKGVKIARDPAYLTIDNVGGRNTCDVAFNILVTWHLTY